MASNLPPGVTDADIENQQEGTPMIVVNEGNSETENGIIEGDYGWGRYPDTTCDGNCNCKCNSGS